VHTIQERILELAEKTNIGGMSLREIGEKVHEPHAQKIQHHLKQLKKKGLIKVDKDTQQIKRVEKGRPRGSNFINIPILGSANCGEARCIATDNVEGFLTLSRSTIKSSDGIFAIKAVGSSMNKAMIGDTKENIEDGDFVLVDSNHKNVENNRYFLSVIDGLANIKKVILDERNGQIHLASESSRNYPPIIIDKADCDIFSVSGKVIKVIKASKNLV
jgi:SOS-response transcriptional repressor LexA